MPALFFDEPFSVTPRPLTRGLVFIVTVSTLRSPLEPSRRTPQEARSKHGGNPLFYAAR